METKESKQQTNNDNNSNGIVSLLLMSVGVATASAFAMFMAWGGVILVLLAAVIAVPFVAIWYGLKMGRDANGDSIRSRWNRSPLKQRLELLSEQTDSGIVIAHRDSTQIVFANSKARNALGESLVGITVEKESRSPVRLVRMNGVNIATDSHPAVLLKNSAQSRFKADVEYSTPDGDISFSVKARELRESENEKGDFLLYILRRKNQIHETLAS